ncbi:DUF4145 domain-containing protein [Sinorhizobium meliloti]|uniref:DUF4145 domain-containing protein n=1 Tax=Rhizobium meliloti TaxID=382 RepID=UPI000FD6D8D5|nr:DUF4145 domain-containing protein [Sinorhizobium meliloti]MDX0105489.1 DUF4145 domain-containing protein [Sinorhizobium meliloti]RVL80580.1 DUF4145 domain-containing protein [Sinorhizobium meliloti]
MALLTANCPRCGARHVTFDVSGQKSRGIVAADWVERFEIFSVCRHCHKSTIFTVDNKEYGSRNIWRDESSGILSYKGYLNDFFKIAGYVSLKDEGVEDPPEHVPLEIAAVYTEAVTCNSVKCWNAAGSMFRLAIDLATKSLLPPADQDPPAKVRRSLGLRLDWMFKSGVLPSELETLADCVKEDGNDGAHDGSLTENEALDLKDFTYSLLDRLYTVPKRLELAALRRRERRGEI